MSDFPRRFGSYVLLAELGRGGMGEVFAARPLIGGLPAPLVVKTLRDRVADDEEVMQRFRHEAEIGVSVNSSHVVRVFDVGLVGTQPYLAMEYVRGWSVLELIRAFLMAKRTPSVGFAVNITLDVLAGLDALHQAVHPATGAPLGVVHRDVSPRNVMVRDTGRAVVIDLGLGRSNVQAWRTRVGATLGTPGYMSPEQAMGGRVDARSDLYNAAQVLWELLMLDRYVPRAEGSPDLAAMRAPVWRSVAERRSDVPRELDRVLEQALAIRMEQRPSSARAFAELLRPFADGAPTPPPRDLSLYERLARAEESLAALLVAPLDDEVEDEGPPTEVTMVAKRTVASEPAPLPTWVAGVEPSTAPVSPPSTAPASPPSTASVRPPSTAPVSPPIVAPADVRASVRTPVVALVGFAVLLVGIAVGTAAATVWWARPMPRPSSAIAEPRPRIAPNTELGPRVTPRAVEEEQRPPADRLEKTPDDRGPLAPKPSADAARSVRVESTGRTRVIERPPQSSSGAVAPSDEERREQRVAELRRLQAQALELARGGSSHAEELRELAADAALWSRSADDVKADRAVEELRQRLARLVEP